MMHDKHHHHTVPKYYLKGFADSTAPAFIWEYHRGKPFHPGSRADRCNPVRRPLRKASVIIDYYGEREDTLAQREEAAKPIIEKIRTATTPLITQGEKEQLTDYISLLIKRTTAGEQRTTGLWPEVIKKLRPQFERDIQALAYNGRFSDAHHLSKDLDQWTHGMPTDLRQTSVIQAFEQVKQRIIELTWQFLTSTTPAFLTSDNPVRFPEPEGLAHPLAFLLLPISSTITLLASTNEFATLFGLPTGHDRSTSAVTDQIPTLNTLTITGAHHYLYSHAANREVATSFA